MLNQQFWGLCASDVETTQKHPSRSPGTSFSLLNFMWNLPGISPSEPSNEILVCKNSDF